MTILTDADLLSHFRAGDECALEVLFERYEAPLFQFLVGVLRDHHQAEDVLQETFIKALERHEDVDPARFRGWLFTVAYRHALLAKRRLRRRPPPAADAAALGLPDPGRAPPELAEAQEQAGRLRMLLEQLPAGQREVIRARVYEGKRFREIAAAMGCPLNTTLARMHEGLKRLRTLWERHHAGA
jgi:RNA polymerase sigma-70 factor (ECF subfamily)